MIKIRLHNFVFNPMWAMGLYKGVAWIYRQMSVPYLEPRDLWDGLALGCGVELGLVAFLDVFVLRLHDELGMHFF